MLQRRSVLTLLRQQNSVAVLAMEASVEAVLYASPALFVGRFEGNANGGPDECSDAKQI